MGHFMPNNIDTKITSSEPTSFQEWYWNQTSIKDNTILNQNKSQL